MGGNGQILRLAGLEILLSAWRWTQIPPTTAAPFPGEPHCPQAAEQDQDGHPHPQRESVFIIITPPALLTPAKHLLIFSFNPHHSLHVTEEQTELSEVREFTQDPQQHRPGDCGAQVSWHEICLAHTKPNRCAQWPRLLRQRFEKPL